MTIVDAGPLLALVNSRDRDHKICSQATERIRDGLITTWPVFTEAMHMVGERLSRSGSRWRGQDLLWQLVRTGDLQIHEIGLNCSDRMYDLMKKYRDLPMDLGDASLVVLAEEVGTQRIFTLDAHFRVYRVNGRKAFRVIPAEI